MYRIKLWIQTQINFFLGLGLGPDPRPKAKTQVFFWVWCLGLGWKYSNLYFILKPNIYLLYFKNSRKQNTWKFFFKLFGLYSNTGLFRKIRGENPLNNYKYIDDIYKCYFFFSRCALSYFMPKQGVSFLNITSLILLIIAKSVLNTSL